MPRPEIVQDGDHWLLRDEYGDSYRLLRTARPGDPLIIEPLEKWDLLRDGNPDDAPPLAEIPTAGRDVAANDHDALIFTDTPALHVLKAVP